MRTFVIAECGSTHDGNEDEMLALVRAAKAAGADAVKFQWVSSAERLAARRNAERYLWAYKAIAFPAERLAWLKAAADAAAIEFMTTAYLPEDLAVVAPLVRRMKIASFEAQDHAFILAHEGFGKQTIISTGLCDEPAVGWLQDLRDFHFGRWDILLLHCVSAYPTPIDSVNLRAIARYELNGLSDHTTSLLTGAFAVAAGCAILEKHLRLDDTDPASADYGHSLPPAAFAEYVRNVRLAEAALGDGHRKRQAEIEAPMRAYLAVNP